MHPTQNLNPEPLLIVRVTARYPCLMAVLSIFIGALLPSFIILNGMISGAFEFELDTNPASFRVIGDSIADRGDAYQTFLYEWTDDICPSVDRWGEEESITGKNIELDIEKGYEFVRFITVSTMFEAHNNLPFKKGGTGGNVLTSEALKYIDLWETGVRQLPSYPRFCERKFGRAHLPPDKKHCIEEFPVTPTVFMNAAELSPSQTSPVCCDCQGEPRYILPRHSCLNFPICLSGRANGAGVFGSQSASAVLLNANTEPTTVIDDPEVLQSLARSTSCDNPQIPGAGSLKVLLDSKFSPDNPRVGTTRSLFYLGGVFQTNGTVSRDFYDETYDIIEPELKAFVVDEVIPWTEKVNEMAGNPTRSSQVSGFHLGVGLNEVIGQCAFWAIFSFLFVTCYTYFHTRSLLLTVLGQVHVLLSFPSTWFVYRVILGIEYMGFLNFISLFVIMGIGADDIFVFVDAWKQSRLEPPEISGSLITRLDWTYRRACGAMLITSITDAGAFYANSFSNIAAVRIFGYFMGTLVCINFLLVITYFPAVVVLHHKLGLEVKIKEGEKPKMKWTESFCRDSFAPKVLKEEKMRRIVVISSLLLVGVLGSCSSMLEVAKKDFRADTFPPESNIYRALDSSTRFDGSGLSNPEIDWLIGLGADGEVAINRDGTDPNNPNDLGNPRLITKGDEFERLVSEPEVQEYLVEVCDTQATNELAQPFVVDPIEGGVYCGIKHYKRWAQELGIGFPVPKEDFIPLLLNFTSMLPVSSAWYIIHLKKMSRC